MDASAFCSPLFGFDAIVQSVTGDRTGGPSFFSILFGSGALATAFWYLAQYAQSRKAERIKAFLELRDRIFSDKSFDLMLNLVSDPKPVWSDISHIDRQDFLGVYEEFIVIWNSGLINDHIAYYMFGRAALIITDGFNKGTIEEYKAQEFFTVKYRISGKCVDVESGFWDLFFHFAAKMHAFRKSGRFDPRMVSVSVFPDWSRKIVFWFGDKLKK